MDRKAKKRLEILRKKETKLKQQLAGATSQADDPDELQQIKDELTSVLAEIDKLKNSWLTTVLFRVAMVNESIFKCVEDIYARRQVRLATFFGLSDSGAP